MRAAGILPSVYAVDKRIARNVVRFPVSGNVVGLQVVTIGGDVAPGVPIMTIVPDNPVLVTEAELRPSDRDRLTPGMAGEIRLAGIEACGEATGTGRVSIISADRLPNREGPDAEPHYRRIVTLDAVPGNVRLLPGMSITVVIPTGSRIAIDDLLSPLKDALSHSLGAV